MINYIIRRLLLMIPVMLLVTMIIFLLMRVLPGDAIVTQLEDSSFTQEDLTRLRASLGLDDPLIIQYFKYVGNLATGDLGDSLISGRPIQDQLFKAFGVTVELALLSMAIGLAIGLPLGILAAVRQDTIGDYVGRVFAVLGLAMPNFWLATIFILFASIYGFLPSVEFKRFFESPATNMTQMLPAAGIIGFSLSASIMRMTRSAMLEVLRQDYIRTAVAKGLGNQAVIQRHALKNALLPVVTLIGVQVHVLFTGTIIMETIFNLPGLGVMTISAINFRDYTIVQSTVLFFAIMTLSINLLIDLSYSWLDPRIKYQ